jgi:hypothetical protein
MGEELRPRRYQPSAPYVYSFTLFRAIRTISVLSSPTWGEREAERGAAADPGLGRIRQGRVPAQRWPGPLSEAFGRS